MLHNIEFKNFICEFFPNLFDILQTNYLLEPFEFQNSSLLPCKSLLSPLLLLLFDEFPTMQQKIAVFMLKFLVFFLP
jgi:hypothetical protein